MLGDALVFKDAGTSESAYAFLAERALSPDELVGIWSHLPYERIGLTRSACFAACPEYELVFIRGKGMDSRAGARYQGDSHVDRVGVFDGSIGIREYAQLCQLVDALGFTSLPPEFRPSWTGDSTATVSVLQGTSLYEVADTGGQGPAGLIGLELALDGTAQAVAWEAVPVETPSDAGPATSDPIVADAVPDPLPVDAGTLNGL
jgi:hypothetical protein